jgi:tetratricopeptide (TPR) repeat protein
MKARLSWAVLLLWLCGGQSAAVAQKTSAQRTVAVVVADAHTDPAQPVPTVRISLSYLDGSVLVTEARDVTNPKGQAWLDVSEDAAQRGGLRIEVTGATNLVIYQPADGQLPALPATINVSMLPKGSPLLLGPAGIQAMMRRMSYEISSLQRKNGALASSTNAAQEQTPDLGAAIAGWAQSNGFSAAQADEQVQQWAQGIEKQTGTATAEQKALAQLALKHYADAAQLFNQASDADRQENSAEDTQEQALEAQVKALQAAQQALLDKHRSTLQQLLDHSEQAAGADQLSLKYHDATQTLESAVATADAEFRKHPDDKGFHELWLQAVSNAANARRREGEVAPADQSLPLLAQSADDDQSLAREYSALGDRAETAAAQNALGGALQDEGIRASGDREMALFDQAVEAYQNALEVRTKAASPQDWAATQMNLGTALLREGENATGDQAMALLDQAAGAYRNALEVYTRADLPEDWAMTQINLGNALVREAERSSGDKAMPLLDQSIKAYRNALEVFTKADLPQQWAWAQDDLGTALTDEGFFGSGAQAMESLDEAAQAYRDALEVYTKADLPQGWAMTQNSLGAVLLTEGENATGGTSARLLDQALQAFQQALEVFDKEGFSVKWVLTQMNILETDFAAGRDAACIQQAAFLGDDALKPRDRAIRDAFALACKFARGDKSGALAAEQTLLPKSAHPEPGIWDFSGAIRILSQSPAFAAGRASWIALFTAVQNGDSAGMTAALHQIEPILQQ